MGRDAPEIGRSDAELLDEFRGGDDAALGALLERYAPAVHRFGLRMCRDPDDAKDVLQDTLFAAARGARSFQGASSLSTWLYTIARSFCVKKRRRPRHEVPLDDGAALIPAPSEGPEETTARREVGAVLEEAIGALNPKYREVLLLRDVEGLTAPEVASVLGIGLDAVKSRLHRARVAVREHVAPALGVPVEPARSGCPNIAPMLSRYLEGEIGVTECAEMEAHVAACPKCRAECDSLRQVLALCKREAQGGAVPPDVQKTVQRALTALGTVKR